MNLNENIEYLIVYIISTIITVLIVYLMLAALPIWECNFQIIQKSCRLPPWG